MRACVQRTETRQEGVKCTGKEPERGELTAALTTGERVLHRVVFLFSLFFFFIPHSEFDIYYHYFCRLYNSGTLPLQSARVEQRSFGRVAAASARDTNAHVFARNSNIISTQYIILCAHCITPEITQQR